MTLHDKMEEAYNTYVEESAKFDTGNKAAATRARKALGDLGKLTKERRAEIQARKNGAVAGY